MDNIPENKLPKPTQKKEKLYKLINIKEIDK